MTREIPAPLRAAAGLAAAAVDEARRLPNRLASLPVVAVGAALQASMRVQQRYAELVGRGDQVLAGLREPDEQPPWARFDEDEASPNGRTSAYRPDEGGWAFADEAIGAVAEDAHTYDEYIQPEEAPAAPVGEPAAGPPAAAGPGRAATVPGVAAEPNRAGVNGPAGAAASGVTAEEAAESVGSPIGLSAGRQVARSGRSGRTAGQPGDDATRPAGRATRTAGTRSAGGAGKSTGVTTAAEPAGKKAGPAGKARSGAVAAAPMEDYERLTLPQVRARLSRMSADDVAVLLEHEREHAARAPYLTLLENRLNRIRKH